MIVVIGCGKDKRGLHAEALYLYCGQLFWAHRRLALALRPRKIFVASAQHGLVEAAQVIENYDLRLRDLSPADRDAWARAVASRVDEACEPGETVVLLAGREYSTWVEYSQSQVTTLLEGLTVGERRRAVRQMLDGEAECAGFDR